MLSTYETNIIKYILTFLNSVTVEKDLKVKVNREDGQVYNRTKRFAQSPCNSRNAQVRLGISVSIQMS